MLQVDCLKLLRAILGEDASHDPELNAVYVLGSPELQLIDEQFNISFEPHGRECRLERVQSIRRVPYLVHTGCELFLMLEGVKPFAKFAVEYPVEPGGFPEEALFEPYVRSGALIKRVMPDEPFPGPIETSSGRSFDGVRKIFYTRPGEEWRIDAHELVVQQLAYGLWNDTLERLEGSLLGYTDAENAWWITHRHGLRRTA